MKGRDKIIQAHGYDYIEDAETGEVSAIQRSTGEVTQVDIVLAPVGSYLVTPEQRANRRDIMKKKRITEFLGKYYALSLNNDFANLRPATVSRLVFLATFLRYKEDCLYRTKRTPMHRTDLPQILKISRLTSDRFMEEVCPNYIREDSEGNLHMNSKVFFYGPVSKEMGAHQKIYMRAVKALYNCTSTSNLKHIGYLFKMLPFVNIEHNILCHNPYTPNTNEAEPMNLQEFCEKVGLASDRSTVTRLKGAYASLVFELDGKLYNFCSLQSTNHGEGLVIYINPRILYSGSDYEGMRLLAASMFRTDD